MAHGMFSTCVGSALTWESSSPKLLCTSPPVGKFWKKLGTPDATYEGMSEPKPLSIELTSPARSLITPLFLYVLVGSQLAGDGVINGCSWPTWPGLGMFRRTAVVLTRGRRTRSTVGRVVREIIAILRSRSRSRSRSRTRS